MQELDDPIPLSALQHAVYCLRQAALIHIERQWEENRFTAEGRVLHDVAHDPIDRKRGSIRRVMALPLACRRLNKLHRADEVQLCAQALCLEEMTRKGVPEGALFYAETRRRVAVQFDAELRRLTEQTAMELGALFAAGCTPAAIYRADRCRACSLIEVCRPKAGTKSALAFRAREIDAVLGDKTPP
jgi:CRISPR-associated exonuclease Cas4